MACTHRLHHIHRPRNQRVSFFGFRNAGEMVSNTVPFIAVAGMIAALFLI